MEIRDDTDDTGGDDSLADTDLHRALRAITDCVPPLRDPLTGVLARAARLRRRRRAARAFGAAAVLAAGVGLGPSLVEKIEDVHTSDTGVAAPPAAVVELPGAYPITAAAPSVAAMPVELVPANALGWPSRGATAPATVVDAAKSYLLQYSRKSGASEPLTADVHQLWALQEVAGKPVWLFIGEGWTSGPAGTSEAYLVDVSWDGARGALLASGVSAAVYPTRFTHPEPGSASDPMAVGRISEISFSTQSGRLLVIGAPQVKTVLYSEVGSKAFTVQKTVDGVALFQRTGKQSHGKYVDEIQVRDANDAALTPPGGWGAGDYNLAAAAWFPLTPVGVSLVPGVSVEPAPTPTTPRKEK